jgi:hypothetical protein
MKLYYLLFFITFLVGLYFYIKYSDPKTMEGLTTTKGERCPNLLIQKDSRFYLYNSKLAKVPGVNPVEFDNLEDYVEFLDWQRSQGIRCPVLYLQQTFDAQGNPVYKVRPSVSEPQAGLNPSVTTANTANTLIPKSIASSSMIPETPRPTDIPSSPNPSPLVDASRSDKPYNQNSYPGYDSSSYYVGKTTPLDKMNEKEANMLYSPNPMDENWGGAEYTQSLVDQGYYKDNEVQINIP